MQFKNILVTGGAGYVGAVLVPRLLKQGCRVTVLDLMIYGEDVLPTHHGLSIVKGDRFIWRVFPMIQNLGKSINLDAFRPLVEISRRLGVARFIYASSSSVYGIKGEKDVHEDMTLEPLTDYSRFKADCEQILFEFETPDFSGVTIRPATVCGFSPRQRLDVVVNILTNLAYHKREITVFGGEQLRPNIHIADMVEAYLVLLNAPSEKIAGQIFNAGYENQPVVELAQTIKEVVGNDVRLVRTPTDDNRSYHISSKRISEKLGFTATHSIREAAVDLVQAFRNDLLPNSLEDERYFNIRRMQSLNLQ